MPERGIVPELKMIDELREELGLKKQEIGILTDQTQSLCSRIKEMEAETERLQMENNMSSEELRKEFNGVAESHLQNFRKYYEEKLGRVEEEKTELKKIISSQY